MSVFLAKHIERRLLIYRLKLDLFIRFMEKSKMFLADLSKNTQIFGVFFVGELSNNYWKTLGVVPYLIGSCSLLFWERTNGKNT